MPIARIQMPDGRIGRFEVPEGTTPEQAQLLAETSAGGEVSQQIANDPISQGARNFAQEMPWYQKLGAGVQAGMRAPFRGAGQMLGVNSQRDIDEAKQMEAPLLATGAGRIGDILGRTAITAPAMAIPGGQTLAGAAATGGAMGMLEPTATGESRLTNTALGAGTGAAGQGLANALASVIRPATRPAVQKLMAEGVTPTPGQIAGGMLQRVEDKATSIPVLGDAIKSAQRRGIEEFNQAAYGRVLKPLGQTADDLPVGKEGVKALADKLRSAYNDILPKLSFKPDQQFTAELSSLKQMAATFPPAEAQRFDQILQTEVLGKMTPSGLMSGETFKVVESQLGRIARGYRSDASFDKRQLGSALAELQSSLRETLARANPAQAPVLGKINEGFANLVRVEGAAGRLGSKEGVFSPAQLAAAVRSADKSVRHRNFAQGGALMQDLSEAGQNVLAPTYPDSGTMGRALLGAGLLGGGYALHPGIAARIGASSLPYMPGGRQLAAALMTKRPEIATPLATQLRQAAPYLGLGSAAYALQE